jgi:UDP-GlcNAc:undecaprenyl-phosphate/decaprenyl-phosphate GlcNAc-1-phosphate transferase
MTPEIVAFAIGIFLIHYFRPIAFRVGLVDKSSDRKGDVRPIPLIGGIAIFIGLMLTSFLFSSSLQEYRLLFFALGILVLVGILDDFREISPLAKSLAQIAAASVLVLADDQVIYFIGDIFGTSSDGAAVKTQGLGWLAEPLTIFSIVALINIVNFIDGHDGLAGILSLVTVVAIGFLIIVGGQAVHSELVWVVAALLMAFLCFNLPMRFTTNRRVYLGDAGSMFLGLVLAFLLIDLSQPELSVDADWKTIVIPATCVPWLLGIPLVDGISVIIRRLMTGRSPVVADLDHIHHHLNLLGWKSVRILLAITFFHLVLVGTGIFYVVSGVSDPVVFWSFLALLFFYVCVQWRFFSNFRSDN